MSEEKERKEKTPAPKLNYKRILRWLWIIGLTPFVFILLLVWFASRGWLGELPTTTQLENPESNLATQIVSPCNIFPALFRQPKRSAWRASHHHAIGKSREQPGHADRFG